MTAGLLPFERRFLDWVDREGMGWSRERLRLGPEGEPTTAYRLTPAGPPRRLLFALHGAGNDALFAWVGLFKRQLLRGTEIFSFDLPGHGRDSTTLFSADAAGTALAAALAACVEGRDELPVHAVGVSLGASLLLASLPEIQGGLTSAALIVAPLRIVLSPRALLSELRPGSVALLWSEREHYGLTGLIPSFGPFKRSIYPLRLAEPAPPGMFGYVERLNGALDRLRLLCAARRVEIPVLLVYGGRDRIVPSTQGEALSDEIPDAELFILPEGTHLSTPMSRRVLDRLDRWLD